MDVTEIAARVVDEGPPHHYATCELCGDDFCGAGQLADVIASVSGRPIGAELVLLPASNAAGSRPNEVEDYRIDAAVRLFEHYGRYGITGNSNVLGWLLGRRPTSFEQYVRRSLAAG